MQQSSRPTPAAGRGQRREGSGSRGPLAGRARGSFTGDPKFAGPALPGLSAPAAPRSRQNRGPGGLPRALPAGTRFPADRLISAARGRSRPAHRGARSTRRAGAPSLRNRVSGRAVGWFPAGAAAEALPSRLFSSPGALPVFLLSSPPRPLGRLSGSQIHMGKGTSGRSLSPAGWAPGQVRNRDCLAWVQTRARTQKHWPRDSVRRRNT